MSRARLSALAGAALLILGGCLATSGTAFQALLVDLLGGDTAFTDSNTVTLRIINQAGTNINEELTVRIDGVQQVFTCTATQSTCDFEIEPCPQTIEALSERRVDTSGFFQGGRNFNGTDESYNFVRGEFNCGEVIIFRFTENTIEAFVL